MGKMIIDTTHGTLLQFVPDPGEMMHEFASEHPRSQVEELPVFVKELFTKVSRDEILKEIQVVEVNVGPGKFAALRSGIAFAKGIARALNHGVGVPCTGFQTDEHSKRVADNLDTTPRYGAEANVVANVPDAIVELEVKATASAKYRFSAENPTYEEVFTLDNAVFKGDAYSLETHQQMLESSEYQHFVARNDKELIGVCILHALENDTVAELTSIAVLENFRKQGVAKELLQRAIQYCVSTKYERVILEVRKSNLVARSLYESVGFQQISTRKKYYRASNKNATDEDACIYELPTRPTMLSGSKVSSADIVPQTHSEEPLILGIETSCDETGASLVSGGKVLGAALSSSMNKHKVFGGVIPEIASRAHLEMLDVVLDETLQTADKKLHEISHIAVTAAPGLVGCLSTGVMYAKGLALGLDVPLYGVNHVLAHIMVSRLEYELPDSFIALIVSGGHTSLAYLEKNEGNYTCKELGETLDDAAGEAFDKVGRLLGLEYPAGPDIDKLARVGNPQALQFPRPLTGAKFNTLHKYDFSFSGLKTAAVRELERQKHLPEDERVSKEDFCASFAEAVADVLMQKTMAAAKEYGTNTIVIGGGFSANSQLRDKLHTVGEVSGINIIAPPLKLCTDNGEMIANLGEMQVNQGAKPSNIDFSVRSTLPLSCPVID